MWVMDQYRNMLRTNPEAQLFVIKIGQWYFMVRFAANDTFLVFHCFIIYTGKNNAYIFF
jgi:hypothetical protein